MGDTEVVLVSENRALVSEWNYDKNIGISPQDYSCGSNKKVWWICDKGHEWEALINNRNKGRGCPYCSNRRVLIGYNDLQTVNPELVAEWDYEKNGNLVPQMFTQHSGKKIWWLCENGHSWEASIDNRSKGKGCPVCKNKKTLSGYNDLQTVNPDLTSEWDYEKNGTLTPKDIVVGSEQKVWWKCERGHGWAASVYHRQNGHGCPYCSNNKVLSGFNDLATINPVVSSEWDYEKNGELVPSDFLPNSGKKVWWKCFRGHSWKATIVSRNYGTGCPICSAEMKTSFPEQACLYYFEKVTSALSRDVSFGKEIDIFLPELEAGIEYDGRFFHNSDASKKKEQIKDDFFSDRGIIIYRIKESDINAVNGNVIQYKVDYSYSSLAWAIYEICHLLGIEHTPDVNIEKDRFKIYTRYINSTKSSSLAYKRPDLASEWDYDKNGSLTPEMISFSSMKVVWWKCKKNHSWSASVNSRNKAGCPICSNRRLLEGYNDLQTVNSQLAAEWDRNKNYGCSPDSVIFSSNKKVWWICEKNHSYEATIKSRSRGTGCPYCSNNKVLSGFNDLQTVNPELAEEWDYEKNGKLMPQMFTQHSGKKVWWLCEKGHSWQASIDNRCKGRGCPVCSNRIILSGFNDLVTTNPKLAAEWNYEKNGDLSPCNIGAGSKRIVWWKCSMEHEWEASLSNRSRGTGCPFCGKRHYSD